MGIDDNKCKGNLRNTGRNYLLQDKVDYIEQINFD